MAARTGKIAQLPFTIREKLNEMLLDGQSGAQILSWVNAQPETRAVAERKGWTVREVTDGNLSEWRAGGHAEWLMERHKILRMESWVELSQRLAATAGGSLAGAASDVAAGKIMELLMDAAALPDEAEEGNGACTVLSISKALASLRSAETAARKADTDLEKVAIAQQKLAQDQQKLEMAMEKFRREMAGHYLDWNEDARVKAIAAGNLPREEKVAQLSQLADLYFGQAPEDAGLPAEMR